MGSSVLTQYLQSLPPGNLCFQPNPGNAGDSLISHATFRLLHTLGIEFRLFDPRRHDVSESTILLAGGGNLTFYNHARKFLRKYHRKAKRIAILPHTICQNEDVLDEMGPNIDILCRERVSYEYVRSRTSNANVLLMEDLAFELDVQESLSTNPELLRSKLLSRRLLQGPWKSTARLLLSLSTAVPPADPGETGLILNSFRTDREKSNIRIPSDNIDVSVRFAYGTHDETVCRYATASLLRFLNRFSEIRTNRLHVAISGALLGKKVQLHANSYFKCKAVYDHSMMDRFPNVEWMG